MEFIFDALIALMNSNICETPQVIESCYHGNRDTLCEKNALAQFIAMETMLLWQQISVSL